MRKWIKSMPEDYYNFHCGCYNDLMLWNNDKVYVMDNHRDAAWCWMQICRKNEKFNFMHIDRHYDMCECFSNEDLKPIIINPNMTFEDYSNLMRITRPDFKLFRWDNFIRIAYELHPEWFCTNLFLTHGRGSLSSDEGHELMEIHEIEPVFLLNALNQNLVEKWSSHLDNDNVGMKWIVNLDLDFFFSEDYDHIRVFSYEFIRKAARLLQEGIDNIQCLTIAMSPDCLFGRKMKDKWASGFDVLKIMAEEILALRDFPFPSVSTVLLEKTE